jgi:hypothetical protein
MLSFLFLLGCFIATPALLNSVFLQNNYIGKVRGWGVFFPIRIKEANQKRASVVG